jgi:hypothetical protein
MTALAHARLVGNDDVLGNRSLRRIDPMKAGMAVLADIGLDSVLANVAASAVWTLDRFIGHIGFSTCWPLRRFRVILLLDCLDGSVALLSASFAYDGFSVFGYAVAFHKVAVARTPFVIIHLPLIFKLL